MLKELLKAALLRMGVSEDHATKLVASIPDTLEAPKDITAEQVSATALTKLGETLGSNDAFKAPVAEIRKQATGKLMDILGKKIRKAVPEITDEEIEALPEENRYDEIVTLALSKVKTAKAGTEGEEVSRLNKELKEAKRLLKKATDEDIPAARAAGERERELVRIEREVEEEMKKAGDLLVKPEFSRDIVMKGLQADGRELRLVNGMVKLMKKQDDGSFADVFDDKHNALTIAGEVKRIGEAAGLYKMNNGAAGGGKGGNAGRKDEGDGGDGREKGSSDGRRVPELRGAARARELADARRKERDGRQGGGDGGDE